MYDKIERMKRTNREVVVKITEVNMAQRTIWGSGVVGERYVITVAGLDPLVAIPAVGEEWIVTSTSDYKWRLLKRFENGGEKTNLGELVSGDRRLEGNKLYVSTKDDLVLDSQITFKERDAIVKSEGPSLYVQEGELRVVMPDGTRWKVVLAPLE